MATPNPDWPPGYAEANKGPEILIVTITLTVIALLFVAARIYSRRISMRKLAVDDYIVIFCIVSFPFPHVPHFIARAHESAYTDSQHNLCRYRRRRDLLRRRSPPRHAAPRRRLPCHLPHADRLRPRCHIFYRPQVRRDYPPRQDPQPGQDPPLAHVGHVRGILPPCCGYAGDQFCAVHACRDAVGRGQGDMLG